MATRRKRIAEGSCWPCRKRRVFCDLTRPACRRCAFREQKCEYSQHHIRWVDGVASRGKLAGKNVPVSEGDDGERSSAHIMAASELRSSSSSSTSSPSPALILSPKMMPGNDQLLLYFERRVLPRFNLATDPLDFDLGTIHRDDILQRAVAAVAKAHLSFAGKTTGDCDIVTIRKLRLDALQTFREHLARPDGSSMTQSSLFLTNILFCILDGIIEPLDSDAAASAMQHHFNGGRAMLTNWRSLRDITSDAMGKCPRGLASLAISIYATMDLVYALLSGNEPYFQGDWYLSRHSRDAWWGHLGAEDPFLELMSILARLAQMGYHLRVGDASSHFHDLCNIQHALDMLDPRIGGYILEEPPNNNGSNSTSSMSVDAPAEVDTDRESWGRFCSAYRHTALIYMYRVMGNMDVTSELVQQSVAEGVKAISSKPLKGNLAHCLLFPTLVIGAHALDGKQRAALKRSLKSTASFLAFGGIRIMEAFLEERWRATAHVEFEWWRTFGDIAMKTSLF